MTGQHPSTTGGQHPDTGSEPPLTAPAGPDTGGPGAPGGGGPHGPSTGPGSSAAGAGGPAEPPPLTAFAWRYGLIRPVQGRIAGGVSGAFARATNTDPILWRVALVALAFFGGAGVMIYLVAWLVLPADGDTASPLEALAGRGRSRTATVPTIIGVVIVLIAAGGYLSTPWRATPLLAAIVLGAVLLLLLRDRRRPSGTAPTTGPSAPSATAWPGAPTTTSAAAPTGPAAPAWESSAGTRPGTPFAPYGPFAAPVAPPPRAPRPPRPPRPRSRLGGITFSLAVLALGLLAVANLLGANLPAAVFVASALTLVGLALVVGAWFGRARWLIPFGIALSLAFGGINAIHNGQWDDLRVGDVTWSPATLSELQSSYHNNVGNTVLDLSALDFDGHNYDVSVMVDVGSLRVILPPDVDVTVEGTVTVGHSELFNASWDGLGKQSRTVTDLGHDGVGGGHLNLTAIVHTGDLEVSR